MNPACTYEINYQASMRLAQLAKQVGVPRFVFSSSCSTYGRRVIECSMRRHHLTQ